MSCAVDSVPGANVDSQLEDSITDGFAIAEIAGLYLTKPPNGPRLRSLVAETLEPLFVWTLTRFLLVNNQLEHGVSVA